MLLTEHRKEVSLEEIMEKEEGLPCNTLAGARDLIAAKLKNKFPLGIGKILLQDLKATLATLLTD